MCGIIFTSYEIGVLRIVERGQSYLGAIWPVCVDLIITAFVSYIALTNESNKNESI